MSAFRMTHDGTLLEGIFQVLQRRAEIAVTPVVNLDHQSVAHARAFGVSIVWRRLRRTTLLLSLTAAGV